MRFAVIDAPFIKRNSQVACHRIPSGYLFLHSLTLSLLGLTVVGILADPAAVSASTITAASCSRPDVGAAVKTAQDGDTVLIPPGTCTWNRGLASYCQFSSSGYDASFCRSTTANDTKYITLQGAGIGQTIIIDEVPRTADPSSLIRWVLKPGGLSRITGIEFRAGTFSGVPCTVPANGTILGALLVFEGTTNQLRIDHNKLIAGGGCSLMSIGIPGNAYIRGVADHNIYDVSKIGVGISMHNAASWGNVGSYGDNSWAQPDTVGTAEAFFFEDSTCLNDQTSSWFSFCFDGSYGTRVVVRHMDMRASMMGVHGTDHGQTGRGSRQIELYDNTFRGPDGASAWNLQNNSPPSVMSARSGVAVIYNNSISISNGGLSLGPFNGSNFRDTPWNPANPFGTCNGSSPYDQNSSNQSGYRCIDQVGAGFGQLMNSTASGGPINTMTGTATWPNQVAQPAYAWNNTINGVARNSGSDSVHIVVGRDLINIPRPGYTSYTYPHPLTTGLPADVVIPTTPSGLKVQ